MKIAYIIEKLSGKGGMERILTDKMNYLAEQTAHEVVAVLLWKDEQQLAFPLSRKVQVVRLNAPQSNAFVGFSVIMWRFRRQIRKINPDLTVYTWVAGAFLACYGGWKGKSIFENHHTLSDMSHNTLVTRASKRVDCVVALSANDAKDFAKAKRVEVIHNFTNISGVSTDYSSKHCLAIGRFVDVKDYPRMIHLWKKISEKHTDWTLDIVGEGPEEDAIKQLVLDENLQKSVILYPATDDIARFYAQSSIYLMTSKHEGLPMVLLEAQACGVPAIAFDCPYGPREIIRDGKTGYLVQYDDNQSFINRISALMDDEDLRRQLGNAALVSSQRFLPSSIMHQWVELFESVTA